jgi:hypothetical protein
VTTPVPRSQTADYNDMLAALRAGDEVEVDVAGIAHRYRRIEGRRMPVASCAVTQDQVRWLLASGARWAR